METIVADPRNRPRTPEGTPGPLAYYRFEQRLQRVAFKKLRHHELEHMERSLESFRALLSF